MVFNGREAVEGLKHLRLGWHRVITNRPRSYYLRDYATAPYTIEPFNDHNDEPALCEACGYLSIRATLPNGWRLETCSAMPGIPHFDSVEFRDWLASLSDTKLAVPCV